MLLDIMLLNDFYFDRANKVCSALITYEDAHHHVHVVQL